ncbi:hypothetical protein JIN84_13795 [Luteolibacter yonseiensis]|uniref:Uncharacterized protein n=1 Tax=Luteolibacter yonseiensis TaxID=1144680 RepID=A0A934R7T8_9BACT|nr:hypothetical protein [Luteolibacter yonseiensis]MBK1816694.1 hypothetical protein [Luteolibacter yonseiensis]
MKIIHLIAPAASLVLIGVWNLSLSRSISGVENDNGVIRKKISATGAAGNVSESTRASVASRGNSTNGKQGIDWKHMSGNLLAAEDDDRNVEVRAMIDFQLRLAGMAREELIAALDEISTLDLSDAERGALEQKILEFLVKKDPQYALDRFVDRIESEPDTIGWQLSNAMKEWAKKDRASAGAWLDSQIAGGKFESRTLDGNSEMRVQFESGLLESILGSDLTAAGNRLAALPEDQRREVLENLSFPELSAGEQKSYAALVRQLVPADEREGSFAHIADQLVDENGYDKVSGFLDSVSANPEERAAAAMQVAESRLGNLASDGGVTQGEIDSLRTWLDKQAPGQTDGIIGKSLAEAAQDGGDFGFSEASQLALGYQKTSGSDEVLIAFLKSYSAHSNLEEARHLAEMISDEKRREAVLRDLE